MRWRVLLLNRNNWAYFMQKKKRIKYKHHETYIIRKIFLSISYGAKSKNICINIKLYRQGNSSFDNTMTLKLSL